MAAAETLSVMYALVETVMNAGWIAQQGATSGCMCEICVDTLNLLRTIRHLTVLLHLKFSSHAMLLMLF